MEEGAKERSPPLDSLDWARAVCHCQAPFLRTAESAIGAADTSQSQGRGGG